VSRHELASRQGDLHERGVEVAVFYRGPYRCHHRPKPTTARFLQTEDSGLATDPYLDVAGGIVQGAASGTSGTSGTGKAVPRLVLAITASFRYVRTFTELGSQRKMQTSRTAGGSRWPRSSTDDLKWWSQLAVFMTVV